MRDDTMRTTRLRKVTDDRPRRRVLGLAVLLLTLGAGYGVAQRNVEDAVAALVEEVEVEETTPQRPTIAEIMAQIDEVATRHRVPPRLVAAIIAVESEFNPRAVSRRGAQGLMQLMPATAANLDVQDTFDPRENIEGGVRHLRVLMDRYHNDLPLVLAAYNAGDRAVLAYRGVPPYRETRQYVLRVLRRYDREAARAAARRIYGGSPTVTRTVSYPRAELTVINAITPAPPAAEPPMPAPPPRVTPPSMMMPPPPSPGVQGP